MKKTQIILLLISAVFFGCSNQNGEGSYPNNPCEVGEQGMYLNETNGTNDLNLHFDNSLVVVQYVTGHPDGDYYHMYSVQSTPTMDFYTFAIQPGDTSILDQNFNSTAGSYLAMDGTPYPQNNNVVTNTIIGGSQVGDTVKIEFAGDFIPGAPFDSTTMSGEMCVTIDEVVSLQDYVYRTLCKHY